MRNAALKTIACAAVLTLGVATAAHAVTLTPGKSVALPGTATANQPELAGEVIASQTTLFSYGTKNGLLGASGSVEATVVRRDSDGTLDFYWQVHNSAASGGNVGNLRLGNFQAAQFDVNWRYDEGGDAAPTSAYQSLQYPSFNFQFFKPGDLYFLTDSTGLILPGRSSALLFMHTSAVYFDQLAMMDVANGSSTAASSVQYTFGPSAVPEPASWALFGLGLLAIGMFRRRAAMSP